MESLKLSSDFLNTLKAEYEKNGTLVVKNIIPSDLLLNAINEVEGLQSMAYENSQDRSIYWRKQGEKIFLEKYEPVLNKSIYLKDIAENKAILTIVAELLNDPSPRIFKDKLIFKAPGQNGYPLHQDYNWWHGYSANDLCTVVVPFDEVDEENGGIEFYHGCHNKIYLPKGENRPFSEDEERALDDFQSEVLVANPGDIIIFHSLTPHFSSRNMSNRMRRQFYPTYCSSKVSENYKDHIVRHKALEFQRNDGNLY